MKRSVFSILLLLLVAVTFIGFPNESSANKARGEIRDGNATGSSYNANDVESSIKRAWERWNKNDRKKFTRGGKASSQTPSKGNHLVYDVYENKGWGISGNNFTFEGWSANIGYFHHDRYNQATYIGAVNVNNEKERKIFKTKMVLNSNAATKGKGSNSDIYYDNGSRTRWCSTNKNKTKKEQNICNMEYKHVGFKAYLPLKELFPSTKENKQWKLYIIKNINGHLVYDQLILPFDKGSKTWNKGTVSLKSGVSNKQGHRLIALGSKTQKRFEPGVRRTDSDKDKFFIQGKSYKIKGTRILSGSVTPWYELIVPEDGGAGRWTISPYMRANGTIATLSYERNYYDITVLHKDKFTEKTLLDEGTKSYKKGTRTFSPKKKGHFKTPEDYDYVPVDNSRSVKVNKDRTITFYYKPSIPDPTRIIEQGGGRNTHGKGEGNALWKLVKGDVSTELPSEEEKDFEWEIVSGGVEITRYTGNKKNVNIPEEFDGKNVVSIGESAFVYKDVMSVKIPDTVKQIKDYAFMNNKLGFVSLPDDIVTIGKNAFRNNDISELIIPNSTEVIDDYAFYGNNISNLDLGEKLNVIGERAFANNRISSFDGDHLTDLKSISANAFMNNEISRVSFSDELVNIGDEVFVDNYIEEVNFSEQLESVGTRAFANNSIEVVIVNNDDTTLMDNAFMTNQEKPKDLVVVGHIPSTAKTYADEHNHTFKDIYDEYVYVDVTDGVEIVKYNGDNSNVKIPDKLGGKSVVSIGSEAFKDMAIKNVEIPRTVHTIKDLAFADNELTSINLSNVKKIKSGVFTRNEIKNVTFNSQLEELGDFAFRMNKLTNVTIPNSITVIEQHVFDENELTSINLHNNITEIKEHAFADNKLKTITLPNKLKNIGELAFWNNDLTEIKIPKSLKEIGNRAFEDNSLTEVKIERKDLIFGTMVFSGNTEDAENFTMRGHCESTANEYAEDYVHTFTDLDGNPCEKYVLATDDDFEFVERTPEMIVADMPYYEWNGKKGFFRYIGDDEYVEIPHVIHGYKMTSYVGLFWSSSSLKGVKSTNKNVTEMISMFSSSEATELDLSELDTSNITSMNNMFNSSKVSKIKGLDTSTVTDMSFMFSNSKATELDLSSFDTSNVTNMGEMFENSKATVGYAGTQADADKFNASSNKPSGLNFEVKNSTSGVSFKNNNLNNIQPKKITLANNNLFDRMKNFVSPIKTSAETESEKSETYLENNFVTTGNHYAHKNIKNTITVDNHTETKDKPFSLLIDPTETKNKNMEYDFEYEYTNHYKRTYKCTDKKGNDCFAWKLDKTEPVWEAPYLKTFKLSDTKGSFKRYKTSRLARIDDENVTIYSSYDNETGTKAGNNKVNRTYYVKEKAVKGNDAYYLLSTSPSNTEGTIGWVNELDLKTYTHYGMDKRNKKFKLTGSGKGYSVAWGGKKQEAVDLSKYKGKAFNVNLTETVGDNIWYRGTISGVSGNVWIRQSNTDSIEIIKIKEKEETPLNSVENTNLTLEMDHKYNEDFDVTKETPNHIKLLIGREAQYKEREIVEDSYHEKIEVEREDKKLETQTWVEIDEHVKYESDLDNNFYITSGDRYYFPHDLDENLRSKYSNKTDYKYSDYAIPLRIGSQNESEANFLLKDNFLITKRTGFLFSVSHLETSMNRINIIARDEYRDFTGKDYNDEVISNPFDASRYYFNVDLDGEQKPNTKYDDNVVLGKLGLSDATIHLIKDIEFDEYLLGHYKDRPVLVEQKTNVINDIDYTDEIRLTSEEMNELKETEQGRSGVIHSFRKTDDHEIIEEVKRVVP